MSYSSLMVEPNAIPNSEEQPRSRPDDDLDLVRRIRQGDRDLFAELVRRHHKPVFRLCASLVGRLDVAEDAAQDVFIKVFRSLEKFHGGSAFSTWLYRLTTNHCMDVLRAQTRQRTLSWDSLLETEGERIDRLLQSSASQDGLSEQGTQLVWDVLSALKTDYRVILCLREVNELSYQAIADTLGLSLDAVKAKLRRARSEFVDKMRHLKTMENV